MKLYYYKAKGGNVGDDLNQWLWPKIFGNLLDEDASHLLIGIGTILNHRIPNALKYTVLTSGFGYGTSPPTEQGSWEFLAVRGPKTKEALNAEQVGCLLDGAYLMPEYYKPDLIKSVPVAYIPHVDSVNNGVWQKVCAQADIKMLDPRWPVEKFIDELVSCECVLTEAMHGAILADAYGVPWHPVKAYAYINDFKWQDWASSLKMNVNFSLIEPTFKGDEGLPLKNKVFNTIKRLLKPLGLASKSWTPAPESRSSSSQVSLAAEMLKALSKNASFHLSDINLRKSKVEELRNVIAHFIKRESH